MREFSGKIAVVTGAASGIGRAFAVRLAEEGMHVVLADFEQEALETTTNELRQRELNVHGVWANVAVLESVRSLCNEVYERYGAVHILVNNAGVADSARSPIWESTPEDWEWVFRINFFGVLYGIQTFVPRMIAGGQDGHVVNTASVAGLLAGNGIYGVSKHGVVALTEALFNDLRANAARIGASVVCPPFVRTRIFESARNRPGGGVRESLATPEMLERALAPETIAGAILEGIREERLYVIPASEFDPIWEQRYANIAGRCNPDAVLPSALQLPE